METAKTCQEITMEKTSETNYSHNEVILTESLGNGKIIYRLIYSVSELEGEPHECFGIEVECLLFGEMELVRIQDVTSILEDAKELFYLLCDNLVTPVSLTEIIDDFLVEKYS